MFLLTNLSVHMKSSAVAYVSKTYVLKEKIGKAFLNIFSSLDFVSVILC